MGEYREKLSELKKEQEAERSERMDPVLIVTFLLLVCCVILFLIGIVAGVDGLVTGALGGGVFIIIVGEKALTSAGDPTEENLPQSLTNMSIWRKRRAGRKENGSECRRTHRRLPVSIMAAGITVLVNI